MRDSENLELRAVGMKLQKMLSIMTYRDAIFIRESDGARFNVRGEPV
jgi:hypothetical protein